MNLWRQIKVQRWTQGSIECYKRGCRCANCPTFNILGDKCKMKESVLSLVRLYGRPKKGCESGKNK